MLTRRTTKVLTKNKDSKFTTTYRKNKNWSRVICKEPLTKVQNKTLENTSSNQKSLEGQFRSKIRRKLWNRHFLCSLLSNKSYRGAIAGRNSHQNRVMKNTRKPFRERTAELRALIWPKLAARNRITS